MQDESWLVGALAVIPQNAHKVPEIPI
jgi:hypothetical protein